MPGPGHETEELERAAVRVAAESLELIATMIRGANRTAQVLARAMGAACRWAGARGEERARQETAQVRNRQRADSLVWRATARDDWWERATPDRIGRTWQAAATWWHVDPRAWEAAEAMADRLSTMGVDVDLERGQRPDNSVWLSDALDRAAQAEPVETQPQPEPAVGQGKAEPDLAAEVGANWRIQEARVIGAMRQTWPADRVDRVIDCAGWPMLSSYLGRLNAQTHDLAELLRRVPHEEIDRATSPGAYIHRIVRDRVEEQNAPAQGDGWTFAQAEPGPQARSRLTPVPTGVVGTTRQSMAARSNAAPDTVRHGRDRARDPRVRER